MFSQMQQSSKTHERFQNNALSLKLTKAFSTKGARRSALRLTVKQPTMGQIELHTWRQKVTTLQQGSTRLCAFAHKTKPILAEFVLHMQG
jgi:hypothetical protein